jgi:hypothetical protein
VLEEMMGVSEQNKLKESCKNSGRNFPPSIVQLISSLKTGLDIIEPIKLQKNK